jgi:hypothetical protein
MNLGILSYKTLDLFCMHVTGADWPEETPSAFTRIVKATMSGRPVPVRPMEMNLSSVAECFVSGATRKAALKNSFDFCDRNSMFLTL